MTQVPLNVLVASAMLVPVAIDVLAVYRVFRFFPFSTAATFAVAPYLVKALQPICGFGFATALSVVCVVLLALVMGWAYVHVQFRSARSGLRCFLMSIGFMVLIQNSLSIAFGPQPAPLTLGLPTMMPTVLGPISGVRVLLLAWAAVVLLLVFLVQRLPRIGLAYGAVADDLALARIQGLNPKVVLLGSICFGSGLSAIAGILAATDTAMTPLMGMRPFMMAAVVVMVGGPRVTGVLISILAVVAAQHLGGVLLGNKWQDMMAFLLVLWCLFLNRQPGGVRPMRSMA